MTSWACSVAADVVLGTLDQRCWVRLGHYLGLAQDLKTTEDLKERFWDCNFIIPIWIAPLSFMKTHYLPSAGIGHQNSEHWSDSNLPSKESGHDWAVSV